MFFFFVYPSAIRAAGFNLGRPSPQVRQRIFQEKTAGPVDAPQPSKKAAPVSPLKAGCFRPLREDVSLVLKCA